MTVEASLADGGRRVRLRWPDGATQELAARWLFDHADEARDPISGQRDHGALALERASLVEAAEIVIFDNRRLLHGRRGLTSGSPRWLRGCYADVDGLTATLARLEAVHVG